MKVTETKLPGVYIIEPPLFEDERGQFIKIFNAEAFAEHLLDSNFAESYYSTSKKGVIRGMHFQTPPKAHTKLVYVTHGRITDVILDIRKGSSTYGHYITTELSTDNRHMMYIPPGFAHGFLALEDDSLVVYLQTTGYSKEHDAGVRFDSFGFDWGVEHPLVSSRDQSFPTLEEFDSPFGGRKQP